MRLKLCLFFAATFMLSLTYGQSVERNTYAVFSATAPNDSLAVAAGQIMTGTAETPHVEHGYYPLNQSLLSIDNKELVIGHLVYPNPFNDNFTVQVTTEITEPVTLEIYSVNGALLEIVTMNNSNVIIDMSQYAGGIYYISAYSNNAVLFNEKVIKS